MLRGDEGHHQFSDLGRFLAEGTRIGADEIHHRGRGAIGRHDTALRELLAQRVQGRGDGLGMAVSPYQHTDGLRAVGRAQLREAAGLCTLQIDLVLKSQAVAGVGEGQGLGGEAGGEALVKVNGEAHGEKGPEGDAGKLEDLGAFAQPAPLPEGSLDQLVR